MIYDNEDIFNKILIVKKDSTTMNATEYLNFTKGNKYRIISIDGCHTKNATLIDLKNAIKILTNDGIIILDDYFNDHWPGVNFAINEFMSNNNNFRLIYLNANKFVLCHKNYYDKYVKILENIPNIANKYESRCFIGGVFKK